MEPLTTHLLLAPDASIDLQLHTTLSDGVWTPEELVDYLVREQFDLVAVTDHDRVDSVFFIQQLAAQRNLPVLAAVEMSTSWKGYEVDVLCYGFDPQHNTLQALAEPVVQQQWENTQQVYAQFLKTGLTFPRQQEVLPKSGGEPRNPTDLVILLVSHGYASGWTAVEKTLRDAGYRPIKTEIAAVVDAAHHSHAVCLIAHPGRGGVYACFDAPLLDHLRQEVAIDGLEVYHPSHSQQQIDLYLQYVQTHQLLLSTGSDSHGTSEQMPIKYRAEISRRLLECVGIQVK